MALYVTATRWPFTLQMTHFVAVAYIPFMLPLHLAFFVAVTGWPFMLQLIKAIYCTQIFRYLGLFMSLGCLLFWGRVQFINTSFICRTTLRCSDFHFNRFFFQIIIPLQVIGLSCGWVSGGLPNLSNFPCNKRYLT